MKIFACLCLAVTESSVLVLQFPASMPQMLGLPTCVPMVL